MLFRSETGGSKLRVSEDWGTDADLADTECCGGRERADAVCIKIKTECESVKGGGKDA